MTIAEITTLAENLYIESDESFKKALTEGHRNYLKNSGVNHQGVNATAEQIWYGGGRRKKVETKFYSVKENGKRGKRLTNKQAAILLS